jgi:hypothetical protein
MMRSIWRLVLLGGFLAVCVPAHAVYTLDPVGGYECAEDMSTDDCFSDPTATSISGPEVVACVAFNSKRQGCRSCEPEFLKNGQPTGNGICAYVGWSGGCSCEGGGTPNCKPKASCTFYENR